MAITIERRAELLARADADRLRALAERCLDAASGALSRAVEVGTIRVQVREPVVGERFLLTDVLACRAEVARSGHVGWSVRLGSDRVTTLAAAVCDLEVASEGPLCSEVESLCERTARILAAERAAHWIELAPTEVRFEELDG
ncbi:MAG: phosphonate C-P lyase system protein PhnG [Acidimicrobiales bacterium]